MLVFVSSIGFATTSYAESTPKTENPLAIDYQNGIYKDSLFWVKWEGDLTSRTQLKITSRVGNLSKVTPSTQIQKGRNSYNLICTWPTKFNNSVITIDKDTYVGKKEGKRVYLKRGKYTIRSGKLNVPLSVR